MRKLRFAVIGLLLIAAGAPWLIQRQADNKRIDGLQAELEQLRQQRTEDEGSSNRVGQSVSPLPSEELSELLRLRNEVGLLRKETNELVKLQAENRQLRSEQTAGRPQRQPNLAAGDLVPAESLAFAGYASPEATFQSILSAHIKGDLKTFLEGFTAEHRQEVEKGFAGKSESEIATWIAEQAARFSTSSVRILQSRLLSDDEAELTVFMTGERNLPVLSMKRNAGEWKISGERH